MDQFPMTVSGHAALQEELRKLIAVERPAVIQAIAEAREHGDLSENAEYSAAREKQGFVEARIRELEAKLSRAKIVDVSKLSGSKVLFGATVTLYDYETKAEQTWTIVGDDEGDLEKKRIGVSSPLARALIGKQIGDEAEVTTPKGKKTCEILTVAFVPT